MIHLHLYRFRSTGTNGKVARYELTPGQIHLLQGPSGCGKSSIFLAITWVLYGEDSASHLSIARTSSTAFHPPTNEEPFRMFGVGLNDTAVALEIPVGGKETALIRRKIAGKRSPSVLEIYVCPAGPSAGPSARAYVQNPAVIRYTSVAATEWVTQMFGSSALWRAGSYLGQGSRNPMILTQNQEKYGIIYELTFATTEQPDISPPTASIGSAAAVVAADEISPIPFLKTVTDAVGKARAGLRTAEAVLSEAVMIRDVKQKNLPPNPTHRYPLSFTPTSIQSTIQETQLLLTANQHLLGTINKKLKRHQLNQLRHHPGSDPPQPPPRWKKLFDESGPIQAQTVDYIRMDLCTLKEEQPVPTTDDDVTRARPDWIDSHVQFNREWNQLPQFIRSHLCIAAPPPNQAKKRSIDAEDDFMTTFTTVRKMCHTFLRPLSEFFRIVNHRHPRVFTGEDILQIVIDPSHTYRDIHSFMDCVYFMVYEAASVGSTSIITRQTAELQSIQTRRHQHEMQIVETENLLHTTPASWSLLESQLRENERVREILSERTIDCPKCGTAINLSLISGRDGSLTMIPNPTKERIRRLQELIRLLLGVLEAEKVCESTLNELRTRWHLHLETVHKVIQVRTGKPPPPSQKGADHHQKRWKHLELRQFEDFIQLVPELEKCLPKASGVEGDPTTDGNTEVITSFLREYTLWNNRIIPDLTRAEQSLLTISEIGTHIPNRWLWFRRPFADVQREHLADLQIRQKCRDREKSQKRLQEIATKYTTPNDDHHTTTITDDDLHRIQAHINARQIHHAEMIAHGKIQKQLEDEETRFKATYGSDEDAGDENVTTLQTAHQRTCDEFSALQQKLMTASRDLCTAQQHATELKVFQQYTTELQTLNDAVADATSVVATSRATSNTADQVQILVWNATMAAISQTIHDLTTLVNGILSEIFPRGSGCGGGGVRVEITIEKRGRVQTQTGGHLISVSVHNGGITHPGAHLLSGGEADRISLAFTLAISILGPSPFLLLDECMASLDATARADCLRAIRIYAPNKIVLNVCHEEDDTHYDSVVTTRPS